MTKLNRLLHLDFAESLWTTLVALFFLLPMVILLLHVSDWRSDIFNAEFFRTAGNTALQSVLSSLVAGLLGLIGAMGLCGIRQARPRLIAEIILLVPAVVPSMYVVLSVFRFGETLGVSMLGLWGVVAAHTMMYSGLVAVFFSRAIEKKLASISALSAVEGAGTFSFLQAAYPLVWRDFSTIILTVFFACVMSFSIPIVLGGGERFSLEILIYELVMIKGDWGRVWSIAILQMTVLFVFAQLIKGQQFSLSTSQERVHIIGKSFLGWLLVGLVAASLLLGFKGLLLAKTNFLFHARLIGQEVVHASIGTNVLLGFTILFSEAILFCIGYFYPAHFMRRFLVGFVGVSPAFTGAAMLLQTDRTLDSIFHLLFMLAVGIFIFTFPSIYRLACEPIFSGLKSQYDQARVLGANRMQIYWHVIEPHIRKNSLLRVLLLSLWVSGDFAFSAMVAGKPVTLGVLGYQYLNGYYLEAAEIVLCVILFIPLLVTAVYVLANEIGQWFRSSDGDSSVYS